MNQLENQKKGERIDLLPSPIQMRAPSPAVHFLGATKSAGTEPPGSVAADGQILQVPLNQSFLLSAARLPTAPPRRCPRGALECGRHGARRELRQPLSALPRGPSRPSLIYGD